MSEDTYAINLPLLPKELSYPWADNELITQIQKSKIIRTIIYAYLDHKQKKTDLKTFLQKIGTAAIASAQYNQATYYSGIDAITYIQKHPIYKEHTREEKPLKKPTNKK